jgi:hypothetical protein
MEKVDRHSIDIAKEKFEKKQDITACIVIDSGVIYQGGFYSDCYLEDYQCKFAYCIEVENFIHLFMPSGKFAKAIRMDKTYDKKGYVKALNRLLK